MSVGIMAERMTAVMSVENCARLMMPLLNPYKVEIVPKVSPVLISSVV
jgi:hypothetical protein